MIHEKIIFWDWNGTLLNDAETCMIAMNRMLARRGMPGLTLDLYKEIFGFPVIDYYRKIGFDFDRESFEDLSIEFIEEYNSALDTASLADGAQKVLGHFYDLGRQNIIVSAMKQDMLLRSVSEKGLESYFADILGIDDIYAAGKSALARNYVACHAINVSDVVFIGDTTHDFEVANEIGCRCVLVADGHQSKERLCSLGVEVVMSIQYLVNGL